MAGCTGNGDARTTSNLYAAAYQSAAALAPGITPFPPGTTSHFPPSTMLPNGPSGLNHHGNEDGPQNGGGLPCNISQNGRRLSRRSSRMNAVEIVASGCGMSICMDRLCNRSKRIDVIARITFPVAFTVFNIVYWTCYLKDAQL